MPIGPSIDDQIPSVEELLAALASKDRVSGLTHDFYRYPARFSPIFARTAIRAFSAPGDLVLDPFMGGGTTAVEGIASGRRVIGGDLNQLAVFVARAKTTPINAQHASEFVEWSETLAQRTAGGWHEADSEDEIHDTVPWNLRRTIRLALEQLDAIPSRRVRRLARTSILRTGQWALDGRRELPQRKEFLEKQVSIARRMADGALAFTEAAKRAFGVTSLHEIGRSREIFHSSAEKLPSQLANSNGSAPQLILTSPPYHGVHILYHRWQVRGRKETNAPYWVSATHDGKPASHYTFGPRAHRNDDLKEKYFQSALASFAALSELCDDRTRVVQLVGFSNPDTQLPRYHAMMREAGFREEAVPALQARPNERAVPNRKWYLDALNRFSAASKEFLLIHRRA